MNFNIEHAEKINKFTDLLKRKKLLSRKCDAFSFNKFVRATVNETTKLRK